MKSKQTVADPGFPRRRGANPPGGGALTDDFAKFSQKLHEIERIWTRGHPLRPLRSDTGKTNGKVEVISRLIHSKEVLDVIDISCQSE